MRKYIYIFECFFLKKFLCKYAWDPARRLCALCARYVCNPRGWLRLIIPLLLRGHIWYTDENSLRWTIAAASLAASFISLFLCVLM